VCREFLGNPSGNHQEREQQGCVCRFDFYCFVGSNRKAVKNKLRLPVRIAVSFVKVSINGTTKLRKKKRLDDEPLSC